MAAIVATIIAATHGARRGMCRALAIPISLVA
jgi:hypothetical protein